MENRETINPELFVITKLYLPVMGHPYPSGFMTRNYHDAMVNQDLESAARSQGFSAELGEAMFFETAREAWQFVREFEGVSKALSCDIAVNSITRWIELGYLDPAVLVQECCHEPEAAMFL